MIAQIRCGKCQHKDLTPAALPSGGDGFDVVGAGDTADDYYHTGKTVGEAVGCYGGALLTVGEDGAGCLVLGPLAGGVVGGLAAIYGWFAGGYHLWGSDGLSGIQDTPDPLGE